MGCRPVSSRLVVIRLRASPFNITIIQAYALTSDYDDDAVEDFYDHLQEILDQSPKKDILVVLGDWNAKVGEDAFKNWKGTCGRCCNPETNERGLRLLEFACYNDLVLANALGKHKASRRRTWHSPNGGYQDQIDYIMWQDIEDNIRRNDSKKAYQLVKTLTSTKQGKTNTIQDKDGNCLTETNDILKQVDRILCEIVQPHSRR
ncbi:unnamed protein product [Porites evermanni]|uniref:Endonuclease/exonuclease/phosphatase domain-containing protein n=1 Tax=Porites evermanni TaxID=104178 RepID=A0ABN8QEL0_9CNID|nr:unnamed protein product [Porites evermanni]